MKNHLLYLLLLLSLSGCEFFTSDCETWIPQKWHIGNIEAELTTQKQVLNVGDTISMSFTLDRYLVDVDSQQMDIDLGVRMFIKITTSSNQSDTSNSDFFATDTTIFYVFDKYFDTILKRGKMKNAYTFNCVLNADVWELEIQYILKKPGNFWARIQALEIRTSDAELEEGTCMQGDPERFGARVIWKKNENNRIGLLFNDDKEKYPEYFGFIVEE